MTRGGLLPVVKVARGGLGQPGFRVSEEEDWADLWDFGWNWKLAAVANHVRAGVVHSFGGLFLLLASFLLNSGLASHSVGLSSMSHSCWISASLVVKDSTFARPKFATFTWERLQLSLMYLPAAINNRGILPSALQSCHVSTWAIW